MAKTKIVSNSELEWITRAGLNALVVYRTRSWGSYRCGYVEVPESSPLFKLNPAGLNPSIDDLIEVTYAGSLGNPSRWFIGFDCAHVEGPLGSSEKPLEFLMDKCEKLAERIADWRHTDG